MRFISDCRRAIIRNRTYDVKLHQKRKTIIPPSLNKDEAKLVSSTIGECKRNRQWLEFYNCVRNRDCFSQYYIPDMTYYNIIDPYYNDYRKCKVLDDKNLYSLFFPDVMTPNVIGRKSSGVLLDSHYNIVDVQSIINAALRTEKGCIIKPSILSEGGKGIAFWMIDEPIETLVQIISQKTDCIIEELIIQHDSLQSLYSESVNSIRILTWNRGQEVRTLSAIVRMGINGNRLDNASQGGIFCGINWDGSLKEFAYDTNGKDYSKHPQGSVFKGHTIHNFSGCVELVKRLAPRFSGYSKLTSWDIAIDKSGNPVIIEVNLAFGEIDFHQIANGPIFEPYFQEIWKDVFSSRKNRILRFICNHC